MPRKDVNYIGLY